MSSPVPWADARAKITAANLLDPALIEWPNEIFTPPEPPTIWLSVQTVGNVLTPIELGGGVWQEEGQIYVDVNAPAMSGTADARAMAKNVANLFRGLGPAAVVYRGASIGAGQRNDPQGAWWTLTVVIDYVYQDH